MLGRWSPRASGCVRGGIMGICRCLVYYVPEVYSWCSANTWKEATCSNHSVRRWKMINLLRHILPTWQWGHRESLILADHHLDCPSSFSSARLPFTQSLSWGPTVRLLCSLSGRVLHKSLYFADRKCTSFPGISQWQWTHLSPSMKASRKWEQLRKLLPLDSIPLVDITKISQPLELN